MKNHVRQNYLFRFKNKLNQYQKLNFFYLRNS